MVMPVRYRDRRRPRGVTLPPAFGWRRQGQIVKGRADHLRVAELRPRPGWRTPSRARADHGVDYIARFRWEIRSSGHAGSPNDAAELSPDRSRSGRTSCKPADSAGTAGDRPHPTCCRSSTGNEMGHMSSTAPSSCPDQKGGTYGGQSRRLGCVSAARVGGRCPRGGPADRA